VPEPPSEARARFRDNDRYRADREWKRLQGTAQRDLFRELRWRFLERHVGPPGWALDAGSGPGRFTAAVGSSRDRRVAADIGRAALEVLPEHWGRPDGPVHLPERVRADLAAAPFAPGRFGTVAALGNLVGFAGPASDDLLGHLDGLVAPGGVLMLEVAPGPGERSRYLARLPPSAVARLLRSPVRAVLARIGAEGFEPERPRRSPTAAFRRFRADDLAARYAKGGWAVRETMAVAPALGSDPVRADAVARDPKSWDHLLAVEEALGRRPERWSGSAAVLLAAERSREG
jgi:hypothetical protein